MDSPNEALCLTGIETIDVFDLAATGGSGLSGSALAVCE